MTANDNQPATATHTPGPATRFTLDEATARAWLLAGVEAGGEFLAHLDADNTLPEITAGWCAHVHGGMEDVPDMIAGARARGILTGPARASIDLDRDSGGEGYRWLLLLTPDPGQNLILASAFEASATVGDDNARGAEAGLAVLREAAATVNELLDDLERHVAGVIAVGMSDEARWQAEQHAATDSYKD